MTTIFVLLVLIPAPDKNRPPEWPNSLQGVWALVETEDTKHTDHGSIHIRMTVVGNKVTMTFHEMITNEGTVELGSINGFKTIDMKLPGKTMQGVYKLDGVSLTMCFDEPGRGRPSGLVPKGT